MDIESVKKYLEKRGETSSTVNQLPHSFLEPLIMNSIRVDLIEPGRLLCSMIIPSYLLNSGNSLHGGATATLVDIVGSAAITATGSGLMTGVSVEISVSYMDAAYADEEIEIDARALRVGKAFAVVSVEFRKKKTGKVFAKGRHTKYLQTASKL